VFVGIKHIQKEKITCWHWDANQYSLFRRVLPSRVNALGYHRLRQTTTLSQHTSVVRKSANRTPRKI